MANRKYEIAQGVVWGIILLSTLALAGFFLDLLSRLPPDGFQQIFSFLVTGSIAIIALLMILGIFKLRSLLAVLKTLLFIVFSVGILLMLLK